MNTDGRKEKIKDLIHFLYCIKGLHNGSGVVHWVWVFHRHLCYLYTDSSLLYISQTLRPLTINQWPAGSQALFYKGSDWDYRLASHKKSVREISGSIPQRRQSARAFSPVVRIRTPPPRCCSMTNPHRVPGLESNMGPTYLVTGIIEGKLDTITFLLGIGSRLDGAIIYNRFFLFWKNSILTIYKTFSLLKCWFLM